MEVTRDHPILRKYINTILPWRLNALRNARICLCFVEQYPEGGEYECRVNGKLKLEGTSTAITNPAMELGIIHSRVLLEFLGLRVAKTRQLCVAPKRKHDINIKTFGLEMVTRDQVLSRCTGGKRKAEAAFVETITAANKLVAHSTEMVDLGSDAVNSYLICCDAMPVLFRQYFYDRLKIAFPNIEPSSGPATSQ